MKEGDIMYSPRIRQHKIVVKAKWPKCLNCNSEMPLPSHPPQHALLIHTEDAMSITLQCEKCKKYMSITLSYHLIEVIQEG